MEFGTICPKCGLPKSACVCESLVKEKQKVRIILEKRKFGKKVTIIEGISGIDLKQLARILKQKLACGGTVRDNFIELQGDHLKKVKEELINQGFTEELIEIMQK
ncbi:MAG: stress response translation initiation inhibitor YciH [Candidatus Pacearchaeota archaeon]